MILPLGKLGDLGSRQAVLLRKVRQACPKKLSRTCFVHPALDGQNWVVRKGLSPVAPAVFLPLVALWDEAPTH